MTTPMSRHAEMVEHMRRHTEARARAAEEAVRAALGQDGSDQEDAGAEPGV